MSLKFKKYLPVIIGALCVFVLSSLSAYFILKYSGIIISAFIDETFGEIFLNLLSANICTAVVLPLCFSLVFSYLINICISHFDKRLSKILLSALLCFIAFIIVTAVCVCFSKVNGIRFLNVGVSLIKNLSHGLTKELQVGL